MSSIRDIHNEWRDSLVMASFRGAEFHVEQGGLTSGRRTVVHEYPKRDVPYSEDMGRHAYRWLFSAYLLVGDIRIGNVMAARDRLLAALDAEDAGILVHPDLGSMLVMCQRYTTGEHKDRGGYFNFDMEFVEAGSPALTQSFVSTRAAITASVKVAANTAKMVLKTAVPLR